MQWWRGVAIRAAACDKGALVGPPHLCSRVAACNPTGEAQASPIYIRSTCPPCDEVESSSGFRDTIFRSPMCMPSHYMACMDRAETRAAVEMLKALSHHTLPAAHDPPTGGLPEMQYTIVRNALAGRSDSEKGATMNSDAV